MVLAMRTPTLLSCLGALCLATTTARAEGRRPFVMGDLDTSNSAGVEFSYGAMSRDYGTYQVEVSAWTLDVVAEYRVAPQIELFGRIPFIQSTISLGGLVDDISGSSLGNVTGGARFVLTSETSASPEAQAPPGRTVLAFAGSVSIPTADDTGDGCIAAASGLSLHGFHDLGLYAPTATTLRAEAEGRLDEGRLFVQTAFGLHLVHIANTDMCDADEMDPGSDTLELLRFGLAGGVRVTPELAVIAEVTTIASVLEDNNAADEEFIHGVDLGVRYDRSNLTAAARVFMPIDESLREFFDFGFGLELGGRF